MEAYLFISCTIANAVILVIGGTALYEAVTDYIAEKIVEKNKLQNKKK